MSIEPMETGVQFLRDATEQYNFESSVSPTDGELSGVPLGQLISDATLESANQTDFEVPMSAALSDDDDDALTEPDETESDLRSNAIVAGSLFDQPASDVDPEEEEREAEDDFAATLAAPLRSPQVVTDDPSDVDDGRLEEIQRQLDERVKKRLRVEVRPGEAEREPEDLRHRACTVAGMAPANTSKEAGKNERARHAARMIQTSRHAAGVARDFHWARRSGRGPERARGRGCGHRSATSAGRGE